MKYKIFLIPGWPDKMNSRTITDLEEKLNRLANDGWEIDRMNGPLAVMVRSTCCECDVIQGKPCDLLDCEAVTECVH